MRVWWSIKMRKISRQFGGNAMIRSIEKRYRCDIDG